MIRIQMLDHTGHTTLEVESAAAAHERLNGYLDECLRKRGAEPPIWARRAGESDGDDLHLLDDPRHADLSDVTQLVCQPDALAGG